MLRANCGANGFFIIPVHLASAVITKTEHLQIMDNNKDNIYKMFIAAFNLRQDKKIE